MNTDLDCPDGLSALGKTAHKVIVAFLKENDLTGTGGCKTFYSPAEWKARGEDYGTESELVVVHDGGEPGNAFSYDREQYDLCDSLQKELHKHGVFAEQCTVWYSAVYEI